MKQPEVMMRISFQRIGRSRKFGLTAMSLGLLHCLERAEPVQGCANNSGSSHPDLRVQAPGKHLQRRSRRRAS